MSNSILVVDDEQSMRDFLSIFLKKQGYLVSCAPSGEEALISLETADFDLVISDVRMSNMDGMKLLKKIKEKNKSIEVIVMTAFGSTADAIVAMTDGAYDYITKPFKLDEIKLIIRKSLEKRELANENIKLKTALKDQGKITNIIGKSEKITMVFDRILKVAKTKTTILISGESGTGKELAAKAIHYNSVRQDQPFVTINCGAIPAELMESELFGHLKGSFTGAVRDKEGLFSVAAKGSLFLDEISEMPMLLQVKLLRALQEKKIMPVGSDGEKDVDTRVIAATNKDLLEEVRQGRFREDLYYRLNIIQLKMPPLRERKDDIPLLIQHFIKRTCKEMEREKMLLSEAAMMILMNYDYPGNVRELSNLIERAIALEVTDQIRPDSLPRDMLSKYLQQPSETEEKKVAEVFAFPVDLDKILQKREQELIVAALEYTGGNKTEAAKILGISFRSFRYRAQKLDE